MNCDELYIQLSAMSEADRKATPVITLIDPEPESEIAHDVFYQEVERVHLMEEDDAEGDLMVFVEDAEQYLVLE